MNSFKAIFTAIHNRNESFSRSAVFRVMLFSSVPSTVRSRGFKFRSHKRGLLYLSALAANNKMDRTTKAIPFFVV